MPKLKVNNIQGIYTNIDENDASLEYVRASVNLRHKKGYTVVEPRHLQEYSIPSLSTWFGETGWVWETGIYCTLTNDPFAVDPSAQKYDSLVLVAKKESSGTVYRSIFWKNIDGGGWYEVTKEGNLNTKSISRTFMVTTKTGKTFFQIENGRLKIYMPHRTFWLGFINRDFNFNLLDYSGLYCDVTVDTFNHKNQNIRMYNSYDSNYVPNGANPADVTCGTGRRLGIKFRLEYIEEQSYTVEETPVTVQYIGLAPYWHYPDQFGRGFPLHIFTCKDEEGNYITPDYNSQWFDHNSDPIDNIYWPFYDSNEANNMVVPKILADQLIPGGTTWDDIATFSSDDGWEVEFLGGGTSKSYVHDSYLIGETTFLEQDWRTSSLASLISASGFDADTEKNFSIITTAVLDDREEIIMSFDKYEAAITTSEKYAIRVKDIYIPSDISRRVTRVRFYHKVLNDEDLDYTLHQEVDLLDDETIYNEPFQLSHYTDEGTTLASNIAFLYDPDNPQEYVIQNGFRAFITESGISIALTNDDYTRAYYSVLGGGVLQPDLIYDQNLIPISGVSVMNAVAAINDRFGVFTENTLYIINVDQIDGALVFAPQETTNLGAKDYQDVAPIQGGVVVNTQNGIYITSGTDQTLVSEPINDIVRDYFSTSSVIYNKTKNELYYRPSTSYEDLYRFRFEDKAWERLNVSVYYEIPPTSQSPVINGEGDGGGWQLTNANHIFIDLDGNRAYLENSKLWVYDSTDTEMPTAYMTSNKIDFGEPSIDKLYNEFIIDYTGTWDLYVYDEDSNSIWEKTLTDHGTVRSLERFYFPLVSRQAFRKTYFLLATNDIDAKFYNMEIDFQVLKFRSYA